MPFNPKERGTDRPLTRDVPPVDEAARVRAVLALRDKFARGDVETLIKLGRSLHKEFVAAGARLPLVRRAAATELLRVHKKLEDFESSLPRGPGGILMQKTFKQQPVPWPGSPKSLAAIAPFSEQNVKAWRAAAAEPGPPLPELAPRTLVVNAPPKLIRKSPPTEDVSASLVKVPGMGLATPVGRTRILANVLRVFSHQALSDDGARAIATQLDLLKYLVLGFEETVDHKARVLDQLPLGHEYSVRLRKEFLADAQKLTPVRLDAKQRMALDLGNDYSRLYRPDNSQEERFWYASQRLRGRTRDRDSGYIPGQIVSSDGIMFVGPDIGESLFWAPDGQLYLVKQRSLRDQQLEAVRIGVVNAAGGVVLGWAVVVVGVIALYAPPAVAAASTWIGGTLGASGTTGLYQSIITSRFTQWLGLNWGSLLAKGFFYGSVFEVVVTVDVRAWWAKLQEDPKGAMLDFIHTLASLGHSYGEAGMPGWRVRGSGTNYPDPNPPVTARVRGSDTNYPDPNPPVTARERGFNPDPHPPAFARELSVAVDDLIPTVTPPFRPQITPGPTAKRRIDNAPLDGGKPTNDNRMTNPSTLADDGEAELAQAPAVVWIRTGTDVAPIVIEDQITGATMSSSTKNVGSTTKQGKVISNGSRRGSGRHLKAIGGGGADEDPRQVVVGKKSAALNGNARNVQNTGITPLNPVRFPSGMANRLGLTKQEQDFLIDNAQTYSKHMKQRAYIKDVRKASMKAHVAAENEVLGRWPDAVKENNALTGVTGPGEDAVRQADTALRLPNPPSSKPPRDIVVDYKRTAYVIEVVDPKTGRPVRRLYTAGYDKQDNVESDQVQAYEVAVRHLGLRVFIMDERGRIFTLGRSSGWIQVAAPD